MKHDCQLTGCLNAGSCTFIKETKAFKCKCQEGWCGNYCGVNPVPLGMESGAILDSQITASSEHNSNHAAHQARLRFRGGGGKAGGWAALYNDNNQWLQVDLQQTTRVTRIATQSRYDGIQWVTEYKLQYSEDGHTFTFYRRSGDHSDTIFQGSTKRYTIVYHDLNPIIEARYIRVLPTNWYAHIAMRMELYTC
ncbi:retinoschisin-like [Oculina patagonica]